MLQHSFAESISEEKLIQSISPPLFNKMINVMNTSITLMIETNRLSHSDIKVPYPIPNGGQQLRHSSGRCPLQFHPLHKYRDSSIHLRCTTMPQKASQKLCIMHRAVHPIL